MWGATGLTRLFNTEFGGQVSWLLPAALVLLVGVLWLARRAPRTDRTPRGAPAVGRLAGRHRPDVQLRAGHHPPVLHGRPRPGDRRARRHRRVCAVARRDELVARGSALAGTLGVTVVWSYVLLEPHARLAHPCAALRRSHRRRGVGRRAAPRRRRGCARATASAAQVVARRSPSSSPRRPGRVLRRRPRRPAHTGAIPSRRPRRLGSGMRGPGGARPAASGGSAGRSRPAAGGTRAGHRPRAHRRYAPGGNARAPAYRSRPAVLGGLLDAATPSTALVDAPADANASTATAGSPRPSAPTTRPASSSPPASR